VGVRVALVPSYTHQSCWVGSTGLEVMEDEGAQVGVEGNGVGEVMGQGDALDPLTDE
jgi:hypothetical protein